MEVKLYVGNVTFETTGDELRTMFAEAGDVVTVDVIKDRDTGTAKGFAFITMGNQSDAAKAITLFNGKEVSGRALTVNTAKQREERPGAGRWQQSGKGQPGKGQPSKSTTHRSRGGSNKRY